MYKKLLPFLTLASLSTHGRRNYEDPLKGIDIVKEYQLIQQKKSALSRRLRDEVVRKYNKAKGAKA